MKPVRLLGWLLLIGGGLAVAGFGAWALLSDADTPLLHVLAVFAIYAGLGLILLSVLRQRLVDRKTDKYKDVQL